MFDVRGFGSTANMPAASVSQLPQNLPASAFDGVRTRRIMAVAIDLLIVGTLITLAAVVLALPTLGLSLFFLPALFPVVAFFYNGFSVSGRNMATPGMRLLDLEIGQVNGARVPFINAAVHAVLFYFSWSFPPVFLVSLLSDDKRCLHDILAGVIVTRRTL